MSSKTKLSKTQIKHAPILLQTKNTIQLGTYYLLKCQELTTNEYILMSNNGKLLEIAENTNNTLTTMHIGGYQLLNQNIDDTNTNTLQFNEENETEILQILQTNYLNKLHCIHWNHMIGDFFGANFYTFKKINYLMPIQSKLVFYCENQSLLINHINNAEISDNINQLSKHIKNKKSDFPNWFIKTYTKPFFTKANNKKQKIEHLIIERKFDTAFNMLNKNTTINYNPYYKHIYSIICLQCLYKEANDIINKRKYFKRMREYLEELTLCMESSDSITCFLIADVFRNYNPNALLKCHEIFISNIIISGCCYMFTNFNNEYIIYNLYGSINCYFYLLNLIENNEIIANNEIKEIIIKNVDQLFQIFDTYNLKSTLFTLKIHENKVLWKIKKENILKQKKKNIRHENCNNDKTYICDICGKGPFLNCKALAGHKHIHTIKAKPCSFMKNNNNNRKQVEKTKDKPKKYKPKLKLKLKLRKKKQKQHEYTYKCKYCDMTSDWKHNVKKHTQILHEDLNLSDSEFEPMKVMLNRHKNIKCNVLTRKRRKQRRNKDNELVILNNNNEPLKKKQKRDNGNGKMNRTCNECGKVCKSKSGLGTHKRKAHGIGGNNTVKNRKRKYKKSKNVNNINDKNNVIVIDIISDSSNDNDSDVVMKKKTKMEVPKLLKMPKMNNFINIKMETNKCVNDVILMDDDGDGNGTSDSNYHEYQSIFTCNECAEEFDDRNKLEKHTRHEH